MKIREIMTAQIATATPDTTLEELATIMKRDDVGSIPIVEDDELCGIITDRDIVIRGIAEGLDPAEGRAEDILTEDIHTVEVDDDVEEAAELMSRHQVRRLPVVDEGRLVGVVAIGDIAVKNADDQTSGDTLENISRGVKSESRGKTAKPAQRSTAASQLKQRRISGRNEEGVRQHKSSGSSGRSSSASEATRGRKIDPNEQVITNRTAGEETERNSRVVPFRSDARSSERKPATRKKAG